jgi:hypothetical protein
MRKTGLLSYPVVVGHYENWLDAGSYILHNKMEDWLKEKDMNYYYTQDGKWFKYHFQEESDAVMFMLAWS